MDEKKYDSRIDTMKHKNYVFDILNIIFIQELFKRASFHDDSKLEEPEKSTYDKYVPMLQKVKYGSDEYYEITKKMKEEGLSHHHKVNRHHPEHFQNGIEGMNLIDLVEMVCDWFAASLRSDTPFVEGGFDNNVKRFNIPPMLEMIIRNTYTDYFMDFEELAKSKDISDLREYIKDLKLNIYENHDRGLFDKEMVDALLGDIYHYSYRKE